MRRYLLSQPDGSFPTTNGSQPKLEFVFVLGDRSTTLLSTFVRAGGRALDLSLFPATATDLTVRTLHFEGTIESNQAGVITTVRLFDRTANVVVTGSTVDNSAVADQGLPHPFSVVIPAGGLAGDVRDDVQHDYEVQVQMTGGTAGIDIATVSSAQVVIEYL